MSKIITFSIIFISILTVLSSSKEVAAQIDLMGLTLDVKQSGVDVSSGNISVEIFDVFE